MLPLLSLDVSRQNIDEAASHIQTLPNRGGEFMKVVMFYEVAQDGLPKARVHYEAHRTRLHEFHARGVLLMAGPFANPAEGAMGVFTSREAAEEFIKGDPFVINGVVGKWSLREWNEVLA
jgi:uncharacterized protein YciI